MGFYIGMKKINETKDLVTYKFDINVPYEEVTDSKGRSYYKSKPIYGYCTLNKITKEFTVDQEKTDPYFLENKQYSDRVGMKLFGLMRRGEPFPATTCYGS